MTVAELGARMSSAEFTEWMAFGGLEPFGPAREDERAGVVAAVIANVNRDPKKRGKAFEPADFFGREPAEPEPIDLGSKLRGWVSSMRRPKVTRRPD